MPKTPFVLVTGASTGIGATYAERFARRGHGLVLVARDEPRLQALAQTLRQAHGVEVDVLPADLTDRQALAAVEARLRDDTRIGILVNNAGMPQAGAFLQQRADDIERLVALNTTALMRLAAAVAPRYAAAGEGASVNIGSVVGLAPEFGSTVYGTTKAYVQAVLPAATRTGSWGRAGRQRNRARAHGGGRAGRRRAGGLRPPRGGDHPAAARGRVSTR